jgi:myo-inositol-1(or 4)-monophosphatase
VRSKGFSTDLVTETDVASGVAAVQAILGREPSATFVVEEPEVYEIVGASEGDPSNGRCWVIDPIDGTTSFLHGYPCFSVSVALMYDGSPVVGAIYNAALDEMAYAGVGLGAWRDGRPIQVSATKSVDEALMVTGFPYDRGRPLELQLSVLSAFLRAGVHGIRRDGSAAIDCCHVASGRCDGFWEYGLRVWDVAAGAVICREAGAIVTDVGGEPWDAASASICVANSALHTEMLGIIQGASRS